MNRLIIPALLVSTGMVAGAAWSQTPPPAFQNKRYFTMPLENDSTREVGLQSVTMPPGAGNQFHRHPGERKRREASTVIVLADSSEWGG
jgi:quercetin dioxygenase-like cupin family protein